MKYVVTGVAGFIGSHLLENLLKAGHEVVGLDNFSTGHEYNITPFRDHFEFVEGDIRNLDTCHRVCKGADYVLHQAALGSVPRSVADPIGTHDNNATGTLNMLVAGRDAEVSGFVFAASSSAYGDTPELPKVETMPMRPMSPYAITKAMGEYYLNVFGTLYQMNTVGVRYFNIFGPRQDPNGMYAAVIPKFVDILMSGGVPTIDGDGEQTRDFTFVANAVSANLLAAKNAERARGEIVNIACGKRISINKLYNDIATHLQIDKAPEYGQTRAGDVRDSLADVSKAKALIDYEPLVSDDDGLKITVDWFKKRFEANQK